MGADLGTLSRCGCGVEQRGAGKLDATWVAPANLQRLPSYEPSIKAKKEMTWDKHLTTMPGSPPKNGRVKLADAPMSPPAVARTLAARLLSDAKNGRTVNIKSLFLEVALDESQMAALLTAPDQAEANTALMLAAKNGHVDTCLLLIEHGAVVEATNRKNQTALDLAAKEGRTKVVEMLKANGALDFPVL